jgi:hypothetical protein
MTVSSLAKPTERRSSFRIADRVYLRLLPPRAMQKEPAIPSLCSQLSHLRELGYQSHHLLASLRKQQTELGQYLGLLERRIELLTRAMTTLLWPHPIEADTDVNLSANGIDWIQEEALEVGSEKELQLVLFPSLQCYEDIVKVISCEPAEGGMRIAVTFNQQQGYEREIIIRHMLERQAAQRRRQRSQ